VLDVACGTGVVAPVCGPARGAAGQAVGLDVTAAMLAVARTLLPAADVSVEWREANAEPCPLRTRRLTSCCVSRACSSFPDKHAALREMHRVLVADGRLALGVWVQ